MVVVSIAISVYCAASLIVPIIVDASGPEEQAVGWYCHLEDKQLAAMRSENAQRERANHHYVLEEVPSPAA